MHRRALDPEVRELASLSELLRSEYVDDDADPWKESPFGWIKTRPSRQRGAIGEKLVAGWCAAKGHDVTRSPDSEADRLINGHRVEIKFSTLWKSGVFKFQQVRDQNYEQLLCLAVSPFDAQCWVVPKHVLPRHVIGVTGQHTGARGTDTAWISFQAGDPPAWIRPYGGSLKEADAVLNVLGQR